MTTLGRNDKCTCGSGKKYKQCCLQQHALRDAEMAQRANEVSQALRSATTHFQSGRLSAAEAIYRQILQRSPHHPDALYFLGMIAYQSGNNELAVDLISQSIAASPAKPEVHQSLGVILQNIGRFDEAMENYRLALNVKKNWRAALHHLTSPLVLTTGMELGSLNATKREKASKLVNTSREQDTQPIAPTVPMVTAEDAATSKQAVSKKLRIILIYPPPWEILSSGNTLLGMPFGAPRELTDHSLDKDFQTITYGLLTIAAQAKRAGHHVSIYNLSNCFWQDIVKLIAETDADVYGISAFTANRRGMGAVAALIRQYHPQAHITVGGPFVTALPLDTLKYFQDIDTAVIGEGEDTFMELLECLGSGRPITDIPGTAWRNGKEIVVGPIRSRINNLDALASPFDYFTSNIVMTSRGCPSKCTFCGSFTTWGKKLRFHSAGFCLDTISKALARLPIPFIAIKDDTFTADRRRTMAICDGIIENKINFMWSCDTRVDCLDEELLHKMRLAGCQMISFGVESGSPEILKNLRKETTPEMVLDATRSAQKFGMNVRYYMILLSRGETIETIQQSHDLIRAGRPNSYIISPMTYVPGTEDWEILCEYQGLTSEIFFRNDFKELSSTTNRKKEYQDLFLRSVCDIGTINGFNYSIEEREAIVDRLPNLHSVHVELANAYFIAGRLDEAVAELNRAEELAFPIANIIYNQRAVIALARGDIDNALTFLEQAIQLCPDFTVTENIKKLRAWTNTPIDARGKPPALNSSVLALDFQSLVAPSDSTTTL